MKRLIVLALSTLGAAALAQPGGGLYIAGTGFDFQQAVTQGMATSGGQRFFVLSVPPATQALALDATQNVAALRRLAVDNGAVFLVCQRDVDSGAVKLAEVIPGVVPVRGWPPDGSGDLPPGQRYFTGENPADLPASDELLRRLRSTCSS
jgi:hypothetical protein